MFTLETKSKLNWETCPCSQNVDKSKNGVLIHEESGGPKVCEHLKICKTSKMEIFSMYLFANYDFFICFNVTRII